MIILKLGNNVNAILHDSLNIFVITLELCRIELILLIKMEIFILS